MLSDAGRFAELVRAVRRGGDALPGVGAGALQPRRRTRPSGAPGRGGGQLRAQPGARSRPWPTRTTTWAGCASSSVTSAARCATSAPTGACSARSRGMAAKPQHRPAGALLVQARLRRHQRTARRRPGLGRRTGLRGPEAPRQPAALRLPARTRRRAAVVGGAQGPELRPRGQAHGDPRRGPSAVVQQLRRHDPARPVRRRHGHRLGPAAPGSRRATRTRA